MHGAPYHGHVPLRFGLGGGGGGGGVSLGEWEHNNNKSHCPSCSKLTMSVVNKTLRIQTYYRQNQLYHFCKNKMQGAFAMQKLLTFFQQKKYIYILYKDTWFNGSLKTI